MQCLVGGSMMLPTDDPESIHRANPSIEDIGGVD